MEQGVGINGEFQKPTVETFNDRIGELIEAKPYQSATDQEIFEDLAREIPGSYDNLINGIDKLSLWEIPEKIQSKLNKYKDNPAPERIKQHGITIQETAIYIAHRVQNGAISFVGANAAKTLSEQLFNYGKSLIDGKKNQNSATFEEIARIEELNQRQTRAIDHLLTIDQFFQPSASQEVIENQRRLILNNFFFDVGRTNSSLLKPTSPYTEQITTAIEKAITMPTQELEKSIIRRKMEVLSRETPLNLRVITQVIANFLGKDTRLYQGLELAADKQHLENLRHDPNSTAEEISLLEQQIARKIQIVMIDKARQEKAEVRDKDKPYKPNNKVHHTLATNLGVTLLRQAGITDYLIGNTPNASALFFITADSKVFAIRTDKHDLFKIYDLTDSIKPTLFYQPPKPKGFNVNLQPDDLLPKRWRNLDITLYPPEDGQRILTLFDMALDYRKRTSYPFRQGEAKVEKRQDNYQKSIATFEKIISPGLQDENILTNYGHTLLEYASDPDMSLTNGERMNLRKKAAYVFNRKKVA